MLTTFLKLPKSAKDRSILTIEITSSEEVLQVIEEFKILSPDAPIFTDDGNLRVLTGIRPLRATREFMGSTTDAVLFDSRSGFALDYFLAIAATIRAGGILVILSAPTMGLEESERFHYEKIETPYFHHFLSQCLSRWGYSWEKGVMTPPQTVDKISFKTKIEKSLSSNEAATEQQMIMADFQISPAGIYTLFAPRGTGKSWLGAHLVQQQPQNYIVTAPNQQAISQYIDIDGLQFRAPDALFLSLSEQELQRETLIIEEAAKMPLSHLERLCRRFEKVLMISSMDNYEGTGQGLREKIGDLVPIAKAYQLTQNRRFSVEDSLQQLTDALMFKLSPVEDDNHASNITLQSENSDQLYFTYYDQHNIHLLRGNLPLLGKLYHLLNNTHYQTSIQDLRRLMDAPLQRFVLAQKGQKLIGAIWAIEEGNLPQTLIKDVFNGLRRPRGNLVAQMLTSQSYFPEAMADCSLRISRISVDSHYRRQGIGAAMIAYLEQQVAKEIDFMSVSFGLTEGLLNFWEHSHYQLIHLGFHLDKVTGLHSAVVVKAFSPKSGQWIEEASEKFRADTAFNLFSKSYRTEIKNILKSYAKAGNFDSRDQQVIDAYRDYKRGKHTVENALKRQQTI